MIFNQSELGKRAHELYENTLSAVVETQENIGKMIVMDVEQGEYEIDSLGQAALKRLRARCPEKRPESTFAIRIGYDAAYGVGATITRTASK